VEPISLGRRGLEGSGSRLCSLKSFVHEGVEDLVTKAKKLMKKCVNVVVDTMDMCMYVHVPRLTAQCAYVKGHLVLH
jgi:hypothetical protein